MTVLQLSQYPSYVVYEWEEPMDLASCLRNHTVNVVIVELTENDSHDLTYLNINRAEHQATENYIHFCNNARYQKHLYCMTPMEFLCLYGIKFPPCNAARREYNRIFCFSTVYLTGITSAPLAFQKNAYRTFG